MRVASFRHDGRASWGPVEEGTIRDAGKNTGIATLREALAQDLDIAAAAGSAPALALGALTLLPPVPEPARFICVGRNYLDHLAEGKNASLPKFPGLFLRFPSTLVGHGSPLLHGAASDNFDYEGELAIVIGRGGRNIAKEAALDHVYGYSCFMDGTMRDFQANYSATIGKNFPGTGGFGPWIVTAGEVGDPGNGLELTTRLNGKVMQHSSTDRMIFDVGDIIAFVSVFTPLEPGDVIVTGTPDGVGRARNPQVWMRPGDVVEVEIERIGTLRNPIESE